MAVSLGVMPRQTEFGLQTDPWTANALASCGGFCYHGNDPTMKKVELFFTSLLVPVDFFAVTLAATAAYFLRFHPFFTTLRPVVFDLTFERYLSVAAPVALFWLLVFAASGLYATRRRSLLSELGRVGLACSAAMASVFAILFFSRTFFESRFIAVAAWILSIAFVGGGRLLVRGLQRLLLRFGVGEHRLAVIGDTHAARILSSTFAAHPAMGLRVVTTYPAFTKAAAEGIRKLKRLDGVDEIWLADPEAPRETSLDLLAFTETEHLGFTYSADFFSSAVGKSMVHTYAGIPVIEVRKTPLDGWGAIYKRAFDVVGSLVLIILSLPLQAVIALAIVLESPGGVFFSHLPGGKKAERVGQSAKPFPYFKFRTMQPGRHFERYNELADRNVRADGPLVKIKDDPRVTRVGKFLRTYSLDEIPEFYLVLLGHMSLVGPRPHLPEEVAKYKPHQRKVLTVKPGITGLAQISGRADLEFEEEVRLDMRYIEHWSPLLDLSILLKTPFVVLARRGAS